MIKSQIPSSKSQRNPNAQRNSHLEVHLGSWKLAVPWDLELGIWDLTSQPPQKAGRLTVTVRVVRPSLPRLFDAQQLTVVLPIGKVEPERGMQ